MLSKTPILLLIIITLTSSINAFDISKILSNDSDLGSFNELLKQTGMDKKINGLQTITVLALDGGACGGLYGKSKEVQDRILSDHVILDYYDMSKIKKLASNKPVTLTTLFQKSGLAHNGQGFLSIVKSASSGDVMLGSGVKDAPRNAMVIKQVSAKPYNISVLQISQAIIAPGIEDIDGSIPPSSSPEAPSPSPPRKKKHDAPPAPSTDDEETVVDDSPAPAPAKAADDESSAPAGLLGTGFVALMGLVVLTAF